MSVTFDLHFVEAANLRVTRRSFPTGNGCLQIEGQFRPHHASPAVSFDVSLFSRRAEMDEIVDALIVGLRSVRREG